MTKDRTPGLRGASENDVVADDIDRERTAFGDLALEDHDCCRVADDALDGCVCADALPVAT